VSSPVPSPTIDELATTDRGVARRWLEASYPGYLPEESNSHRDFSFRSRHVRVGSGSLARLRYSLSADNNLVLSDVLVVVQPDDGGMKVSLGRHEDAVLPGSPVLLPAHQVVSVLWADTVADCVGVRTAEVERVAVETTGLEGTALRFTGLRPMSPALGRRWGDAVRRVVDVLVDRPEVGAAPLVTTALTQRLARAVLETFPSTTLVSHRRLPPDHATPAVVRRAIEHIEANAHREMTLTEIAGAAGIGARGLQAAFLRHLDTTPTACAERVRMARAHRDLVDSAPGGPAGVPTIAARWGFADHRRFAAAYRETYGRLPVETLRR
jgi:AraC-like DNA-binding protein